MHDTSHISAEAMKSVLESIFSIAVAKKDKDAAAHLRNMLLATHSTYQSVIFDILELSAKHDRRGLAEMAFLIGMQAGYELGIQYPPAGSQYSKEPR